MLAIPLRRLGQLAMFEGDLSKAEALITESLVSNWSVRDYRGVGACVAALGELTLQQGKPELSARLFGVVEGVLEFIKTTLLPFDQQRYERKVRELREQFESTALTEAWAEGRALPLEQAVEYALATLKQATI
jgi:hypothetical protein